MGKTSGMLVSKNETCCLCLEILFSLKKLVSKIIFIFREIREFIYIFRETVREGQERERNMDQLPLSWPPLGT